MITRRSAPLVHEVRLLGFGRRAAERLAQTGTLLDLPVGKAVCREGERGLEAFLILRGEVEVALEGAAVTLGPGEVVGELATIDPSRDRNATVTARTDLRVLVYDARTYRSLADDPQLRPRLAPERVAPTLAA